MPLILSIETATPVCSVAIHDGNKLLATSQLFIEQSASSKLAVMIDDLLKYCQLKPDQLSAVAVSAGPGSYTGLRIGVATAKGLCFSLDIPLISVNTLESLAKQVGDRVSADTLLCPMLDARRMEVYCMLLEKSGRVVMPTEAKVIDELSFESELQRHPILFFGNGANKCKEVIRHSNADFLLDVAPSAKEVGELACIKFEKAAFEDTVEFEPFYLKDFLIKKPKSVG